MKKYDSYKDSGVEWIGEIPSHWDVTRIKYKFQIGRGRVISNEDLVEDAIYPVYSSQTLNNGCLGYIETFDFDDKLITWTTDGANAGTVFLREGKFNCTNVCGTLKGKSDDVIPEFDYYFLQYATQFYKRPDTNGAKIMNNEMAVILSLMLSTEEQTAIAKYLDHKTNQIDKLIAKKEQFIQLLEEERVAVINQAVTKGLDPNVSMKDSGIEWLGQIPKHWEVNKIKSVTKKIGSGVTPKGGAEIYELTGIPLLRSQNVYFDGFRLDNVAYITREIHDSMKNSQVLFGDVLLNITGGSIGRCYYVTNEFEEANVNQHVCIVRPNERIITEFLYYVLSSTLGQQQIDLCQTGGNREALNFEQLKNFFLILPSIDEQHEIVYKLKKSLNAISLTIEKLSKEIELINEFKTALISEVVTGKLDVRNEKIN
jgi:type I restriction enzyme S subunit